MPVSLGVPEVIVGNISSGQVVLRDIQFVPTTQIKAGTSNGPETLGPIDPSAYGSDAINPTINLNTPVMADERLVLFNRSSNSYITTTPVLGKEALSKYPNIEFVGSFDSRTANLVAKELAANPPSNVSAQIMDMAGKTDIGENMQFLAILNAIVTAMGTRGQILKDLLDSGELTTVPDIQRQWDMAAQINNFETVYQPPVSEFIIETPRIRTTKAIGEEVPPQMNLPINPATPIRTTMMMGEESSPYVPENAQTTMMLGEESTPDRQTMDLIYCTGNEPGNATYYVSNARAGCKVNPQGESKPNAVMISKEEYARQVAQETAKPVNWWSTPNMPGSFVNPLVSGSPRPPWDMDVNPPMQLPMPSNCVPVPPGVPPVPPGCVPIRPPIPPQPPDKYDDSGDGVGSV